MRPSTFVGVLLLLGLLAVGLRFWALEASDTLLLTGDEGYYFDTATQWASGNGYVYSVRGSHAEWPPGYSFFLSRFVEPETVSAEPGRALRNLIDVQIWLGGLLVLLCGGLARVLMGPAEGIAAACMAAVYPDFIAFSHYLFSETFFTVLLLGAVLALVAWEHRPGVGMALLAGGLFGLATLTREIALPMAAAGVAWWWFQAKPSRRGRVLAHGALLALALAAVVLPWTLRNASVLDRFVLVSNAGWLNLRSGNTLVEPEWMRPDGLALEGFRNTYFAIPDEMERADYARNQGWALIRSAQPSWVFKKAARTVALLGSPDSYLFKKISRGAYPDLSIETTRRLLVLGVLSTSAIFFLALPGLAAARGSRGRGLVGGLVAVSFAVYLVANASSRYRFPWMPLLIVFAASTLVSPGRVLRSLRPVEWAFVGALAALYLAVAVPYFWPDAGSLWSQGTYVEPHRP